MWHIAVSFSLRSTPRQGFKCREYIKEMVPGDMGWGAGRQEREGKKPRQNVLSI